MKEHILKLTCLILIIFLVGCDQTYSVDYEIENRCASDISVFIDLGYKKDSFNIANNSVAILFNEHAICCTTEDFLDGLKMLHFDMTIQHSNGLKYNKQLSDITNWTKIYPNKSGIGKVKLLLRTEDFDN